MQVSPKQVADNFLGWMGVLEDGRVGIEGRMEGMSITPSPNPPQHPPPTQPSPRPPITLPPSRGETGPTQDVNSTELEHPVLARPSPHGTPSRSTPGEPGGGSPSSGGGGSSGVAGAEASREGSGGDRGGAGRKRRRRGKQVSLSVRRARRAERERAEEGAHEAR